MQLPEPVERPTPLRQWIQANRTKLNATELREAIGSWYARDGGASIVAEVISLMRAGQKQAPTSVNDCRSERGGWDTPPFRDCLGAPALSHERTSITVPPGSNPRAKARPEARLPS